MIGKINTTSVEKLKPGERIADKEVRGFLARRLDSGAISYAYRYRVKGTNEQRLISLGIHGTITAEQARTFAKKRAGEVADGKDPKGEREESRTQAKLEKLTEANTVGAILDKFEARYSSKLRSGDQIKSSFERHVRPRIGAKSIYDLKRRDVVEMLDAIEDGSGAVMADRVLAHVRKAFNWWMVQDEEFKSPIVRGMARTKPKELARKRILADDEIRDIWSALDLMTEPACYPAYVRTLLLTMTRRNEAADIHASEIDGDVWVIPASRYKNKQDHAIPLSTAAKALLPEGKAFLFSTTGGKKAFSGFSKAKAELDRLIAKARKAAGKPAMPRWTLHDLRRTGRTLMARAGIPEDHAERAMGHTIQGVRGTYDRFAYLEEKRRAFDALASTVALILDPPADNVVTIGARR
ncbi:tyrosine-type recombinase/integrase [Bradyrhizobium symbiodeficiens]|uniref:tyrosine-type recombinase/integrase n=1 Tax=Bradyrhizobium symbiodeficiens TaxID=1404367 RepID=UPI0030D52B50